MIKKIHFLNWNPARPVELSHRTIQ